MQNVKHSYPTAWLTPLLIVYSCLNKSRQDPFVLSILLTFGLIMLPENTVIWIDYTCHWWSDLSRRNSPNCICLDDEVVLLQTLKDFRKAGLTMVLELVCCCAWGGRRLIRMGCSQILLGILPHLYCTFCRYTTNTCWILYELRCGTVIH